MADDRVFIKCKFCGGWKMLLKHFKHEGPKTRDNGVLEWLDSHAKCNPKISCSTLDGEVGFTLHTESEKLDMEKKNYRGR